MRKHLFYFLFSLVSATGMFAQGIYPVTVVPQLRPPAPIYLASYADATTLNGPLQVQLILNDLSESDRQVTLKTYIEGGGLFLESKAFVSGATPLFLEGGVPLVLTNAELAPYFAFENLNGISPSAYGQALPEGLYQFCFEVYDAGSGALISSKSCVNSMIFRNAPPLLVLPETQTTIQEQNPQYIVFQWTPRHINVTNVTYELSLVEIWDEYIDPQAAFFAAPPVFQTTTQATTYVYGPSDPPLLAGKKYAWRLQAKAMSGAEEIGLFTNNGYSEVFWFRYQAPCPAPQQLQVLEISHRSAKVGWLGSEQLDYTVKYREKDASQWYDAITPRQHLIINGLKPETTYQYQVSGNCEFDAVTFSPVYEFTTLSEDAASYQGCDIAIDPISISNQEPVSNLYVNDVITAGDFPVTLLSLEQNTPPFTGMGYIIVPWLGDTKISAAFEGIMVNTDMQLYSGEIRTTYDPTWGNVGFLGDMFDFNDDTEEIVVDGTIEDVYIDENGNVVVVVRDENGDTVEIEHNGGAAYIIKGNGNDVYYVDEDGNITQGELAEGGQATAQNTLGVNSSGSVTQLTTPGVTVSFEAAPNTTYALDEIPENQRQALASHYRSVPDASGGNYDVISKAVKNTATDLLYARLQISNDSIRAEDIKFRTKSGVTLTDTLLADNLTYELQLKGVSNFEKEEIQAYVMPKTEGAKQTIAGVFDLYSLGQKNVNVTLIPVNGMSLNGEHIEQQLNAIYDKAAVYFNVTIGAPFSLSVQDFDSNGDDALEIGTSNWLDNYTGEQYSIINKFKAEHSIASQMHYVFVSDDITPSKSVEGFMPLLRRYGFVFANSIGNGQEEHKGSLAKVLAHELGHGAFGLRHPFTAYGTQPGITDFLMDYGPGTALSHMDWEQIHDPNFKLYLFQDDDEGEHYATRGLFSKLDFGKNEDETYTFITPSGQYLIVPNNVEDVTKFFGYYGFSDIIGEDFQEFLKIVPGTLKEFKIDGKLYTAKIEKTGEQFILKGYFDENNELYVPDDYGISAVNSFNDKAIIFAFSFENGRYGYNAYLLNIAQENKFSENSEIIEIIDFPVVFTGNYLDKKEITFESGNSQFSMSPENLQWTFDSEHFDISDKTLFIRNKIAELRALYPEYVNHITENYGKWNSSNVCNNYGFYSNTFEAYIQGLFCIASTYETSNPPNPPSINTTYSLNTETDIPSTSLEWQTLYYNYLKEHTISQSVQISETITLYNQIAPISDANCISIAEIVNSASQNDISQLNSEAILHLVSKLLNEGCTEEGNSIYRAFEDAIVKLIKYSHPYVAKDLILGLESKNKYDDDTFLYEQLFWAVDDDYLFGLTSNNRSKLISACTSLMYRDKNFFEERLSEAINTIEKRVFIYEHSNFVKSLGIAIVQASEATSVIDELTGVSIDTYVERKDIDKEFTNSNGEAKIKISQTLDSGWFTNSIVHEDEYRPFDLVIFVNKSNLSLVKEYTNGLSDANLPIPAIAVAYVSQAGANETTSQAIYTAIDVVSLVGSGGTLAAVNGLSKLRKIFLVSDIIGSGLSITATSLADNEENDQIRQILNTMSAVSGIVSLGDNVTDLRALLKKSKDYVDAGNDVNNTIDQIKLLSTNINNMEEAALIRFVNDYPEVADNYIKLALKHINDKLIAGEDITGVKQTLSKVLNLKLGNSISRFIAKSGDELKAFLDNLTEIPESVSFNGKMYRYISSQYTDPKLIVQTPTSDVSNRFRTGLYLSETKSGSIIEVNSYGGTSGKTLYELTDVQVDNLLDLTDANTIEALGTTFEQMKLTGVEPYEYTQEVAIWAKSNGYSGIKFYGTQGGNTNYTNFVIFEQSIVNSAIKGNVNSISW